MSGSLLTLFTLSCLVCRSQESGHPLLQLKNISQVGILVAFSVLCRPVLCQHSSPLYFDHLTIDHGLSHNTVFDLLQDQHGYIWIATQNGLNKYNCYTFEVYLANNRQQEYKGFLGKIITALHEDEAGNLWVGTKKFGLNVRWNGSDQFMNLHQAGAFTDIEAFEISSIANDQVGNIWITTVGGGVLSYNRETGQSRHYNQANSGLGSDLAFDVLADNNGFIWVATAGTGLNILQRNGQFAPSHEFGLGEPSMAGYRKKMLLDGNNIWLGTEGTGLYRINTQSLEFVHFNQETGGNAIHSSAVTDILRGEDGLVYIATDGGGLHVYDEELEEIDRYTYQVEESMALNSNALFRSIPSAYVRRLHSNISGIRKQRNRTWEYVMTLSVE